MKQIKISSYFSCDGSQRKRTFGECEASTSKKSEATGNKKRKTATTTAKGKTNKENASVKMMTAFATKSTKLVLSPTKLTDNIQVSPKKLSDDVKISPRKLTYDVPDDPQKLSENVEVSLLHDTKVSPKKLSENVQISPKKQPDNKRISPRKLTYDTADIPKELPKNNRISPRKLTYNIPDNPNNLINKLNPEKISDNLESSPEESGATQDLENEFSDVGFEEMLLDDCWTTTKSDLYLNRPIRCEVIRFTYNTKPKHEQILQVRAVGSDKSAICKLRDMWTYLKLNPGELICVKATESDGDWIIDAKDGFVILKPDVTLSVTTLVRGMFCLRKGVLSNLHKNMKSNGRLMTMGRVVHDLLQESLKRNLHTEDEVKSVLTELLTTAKYLREFYLSDMKMDDVTLEATTFVPKIVTFMATYIRGEVPPSGGNFRGRITDVIDIEELAASPCYGVQGRIDVTVKVELNNRKRVMPLELKTGRASFSKEHKIQVVMYALLLDEIVRNVDSGLLLYLRDGVLEEVKPDLREIRDFLMLRNEFVRYETESPSLPDPIRSSTCSQCSYSRLCVTYLRADGLAALSPSHPIRELNFPDISDSHVEYFINWTRMLFLESTADRIGIDDATLIGEPTPFGDEYRHMLRLAATQNFQSGMTITIGNQRGKIVEVADNRIAVLLSQKLNPEERHRIESSKSSIQYLYLTNLGMLLDGEYQRLRELIIDRAVPECEPGIAKDLLTREYLDILKPLNREQQRAIFKVTASNEYLLIRGPPGTGKTETIVSMIKFLHVQGKRVLITSHTHSSIDNILLRLTGIDYLRFGSLSSIDKRLHENCFARLVENCATLSDVERLYNRRIVASTCLGLDLEMIEKIKFDVCLMDESSQVLQPEAIRPLLFSRKFVLIGDSNQLPPVVKSPEAKKLGMDVSIFERLESEERTISLNQQYRMNEALNQLANDLTYGGALRCGNAAIARATLKIAGVRDGWMRHVLSPEMDKSVVFVDTSACRDACPPCKRTNPLEAGIITQLLSELIGNGTAAEKLGVVTPFCAQVQFMSNVLESLKMDGVEVRTVDQYQGRDKDVMILSCVRVKTGREDVDGHILNDHRRLTVAVTRAKVKLIVLGDSNAICVYTPMKKFLSLLSPDQIVRLRDGENGFSASDCLSLIGSS